MNEERQNIANEKYNNGKKLSIEEAFTVGALDELISSDWQGNSRIECPKNDCTGTLILKESRYGYEPYIGCTSKTCNYYTTIKKVRDKFLVLAQNNNG